MSMESWELLLALGYVPLNSALKTLWFSWRQKLSSIIQLLNVIREDRVIKYNELEMHR